jgi:hypothetical protein
MIRVLAGALTLVLVGVPLLTASSAAVGGLGAAAGLLCGGAVIQLSTPLLAAGAALGLIEYALALLISGGSPDFVGAIVLGVTLSLLFHLTEFAGRFREVEVDVEVLRGQVRFWIGAAAGTAVGGIILVLGANGIAFRLPLSAYPAVSALAAAAAFVALVQTALGAVPRGGEKERADDGPGAATGQGARP